MIKTKLIFVDGITGSGKSTTAHFICRQLNKNGIKAKWFYEIDQGNPFSFRPNKAVKTEEEHAKLYLADYTKQLEKLADEFLKDDTVYIAESFLFQDVLNPLLYWDIDRDTVFNFYKDFIKAVAKLDPVVIHYYQDDVPAALRKNFQIRGDSWKANRIATKEEFAYCKNRNLKGEEGYINFFQEMSDISLMLFKTFDFRKLQIENSKKDWISYRKQVLEFLDIKQADEILFDKSYEKYCGNYLELKVHIVDDRLCIDTYWPDLKLIQTATDEFEIEGMPTSIQFIRNENDDVISLKFTNSSGRSFERPKTATAKLSDSELEKFCGNYWCESEKIVRKILLKNNQLYYYRKKHDESRIYPVSETRFSLHNSDDQLEFKQIAGEWNFIFAAKGEKQILFIPDKIDYDAKKKSLTEIFLGRSNAEFKEEKAYAPVLLINRSNGNLYADFRKEDFDKLGIKQNEHFEIGCCNKSFRIFYGATYIDAPYNHWIAFFDPSGKFKVARNYRNAARPLGCAEGDLLFISRSDQPADIPVTEMFQKASELNDLSIQESLKRNFPKAIELIQEAIRLDQNGKWFYTSLAHYYLLSGRFDEAKQIYMEYKGSKVLNGSFYFEDIILDDFDDLKQMNLYHPDFDKIKELYKEKTL